MKLLTAIQLIRHVVQIAIDHIPGKNQNYR